MHKRLVGVLGLVIVLAMFVVEPGYAKKRETNAVPEAVFVNALSDVSHEILAVRLKVTKIDNYRLELSIEELTGTGEVKFLASETVQAADLDVVSSTKKSMRVDFPWPETELIEADSRVRCCAQVIETKKNGSEVFSDLICIDLDPILE